MKPKLHIKVPQINQVNETSCMRPHSPRKGTATCRATAVLKCTHERPRGTLAQEPSEGNPRNSDKVSFVSTATGGANQTQETSGTVQNTLPGSELPAGSERRGNRGYKPACTTASTSEGGERRSGRRATGCFPTAVPSDRNALRARKRGHLPTPEVSQLRRGLHVEFT